MAASGFRRWRKHSSRRPPDGGYLNYNTAEGDNALFSLTTGQWQHGLGGFQALMEQHAPAATTPPAELAALLFNIGNQGTGEGTANTAVGAAALLLNTSGANNTANGTAALELNESGSSNTATGAFALFSNTAAPMKTPPWVLVRSPKMTLAEMNLPSITRRLALMRSTLTLTGPITQLWVLEALLSNNNAQGNTAVGDRTLTATTDW